MNEQTSYCPHCENWHTGICQDIPRERTTIPGIDTPLPTTPDVDWLDDWC